MVDYLEGLGDSLDLVPIGAWWGQGRKAGWWSPILLACHNPETGALEAVCKCQSSLFLATIYADGQVFQVSLISSTRIC
jgi:DNA ligase-1